MADIQIYQCNLCLKTFTRPDNLHRHKTSDHPEYKDDNPTVHISLKCPHHGCARPFKRSDNLDRHIIRVHQGATNPNPPPAFNCAHCGKGFGTKQHKDRHEKIHVRKLALPGTPAVSNSPSTTSRQESSEQAPDPSTTAPSTNAIGSDAGIPQSATPNPAQDPFGPSSLPCPTRADDPLLNPTKETNSETSKDVVPMLRRAKRALRGALVSYKADAGGLDPAAYLNRMLGSIQVKVASSLKKKTGLKLSMSLQIRFYKVKQPEITSEAFFWSRQIVILRGNNILGKVEEGFPKILDAIDAYTKEGSGWAIERILGLECHLAQYRPLSGNTYAPIPPKLQAKKAILNIVNQDQKCFLWSILAHFHPVQRTDNANRVNNYIAYEDELDCDGFEFPMKTTDISKFEARNKLSINVYGYDDVDGLHPLHLSENRGPHIGLLLYNGHYSLIRNLNRLLGDQNAHARCKWFCHRCLFPFYSKDRLEDHLQYCGSQAKQTMSDKEFIKFENIHRQQKQPVVVYADFECLLEPIQTCSNNPSKSSTEPYQVHTPCGFGLIESRSCCGPANFQTPTVYRGADCVERFLKELQSISMDYHQRLDDGPGLKMNIEDNARHSACDECHICKKEIVDSDDKVRDHCHMCGDYRGPAHNQCNQAFRLNRDIVVVFHNLRRYDGHLIMKNIAKSCSLFGWELSCIARAMEDYLGFRLHTPADRENGAPGWNIRFIDSAQFLSDSLESLVGAMPREDFKALSQNFQDIDLLVRKGVYPYEHMDSWKRFDETELPPKNAFYSKLAKAGIDDEDYEHAKHIWHEFGIQNMGMFHDHYLKSDTLQLADVVEKFRAVCMTNYDLDPMHYITLPSFGWDACLKLTDIKLETLQNPDQYTFIEEGIRGGISVIMHRHCKANNPKCNDFDPSKPVTYIQYLDANNLYGYAMVQDLPTHGFHWVDDLSAVDWATTDDGYIVEVDLDYPAHLHDLHSDYPLAPERLIPTEISPYCQRLREELDIGPTHPKLIPNLRDKRKYITHIKNLQFYLKHGMVLKKVHRALGFQQSPWMQLYIELNTRLRTAATSEFEKKLFKLMNNAVFGKTMENVRAYKDVKMVHSKAKFQKLAKDPRYSRSCIFDENFVGVMMKRKVVCLDKPIYVGFSVLDLSKIHMYRFHYEEMLPRYGNRLKMVFTDTDSFIYLIETPDVYADMMATQHLYDTSDYPKNHPLYSLTNKKVLGKMKDEMNGDTIAEFAGLRPKMYSYIGADGKPCKKAKGIKRSVVKNEISFDNYLQALNEHKVFRHSMNLIRSKDHQLYTMSLRKTSLSPYDDKRYILDDGISTLAHGHADIPLLEAVVEEPMEIDDEAMEIDGLNVVG